MYSICFWSSLIPRFLRLPCSFLKASMSSNRTFALLLKSVALRLEGDDFLVVFIPQVLVFLCFFHEFPGLVVE